MRLSISMLTAMICLSLAGCAGCTAVPIAKPWESTAMKENPCAHHNAKASAESTCPSPKENPDF